MNNSDLPLITAVIACHEGDSHYLPRAMASIKKQTIAQEVEVIIAFDGPPHDKSQKVFTENPSGLPKSRDMVVWTDTKTGYYTVPRNRALPIGRGAYVAHLDIDNEWRPTHLEALLEAIRVPTRERGFPYFTYARREYVKDEGVVDPENKLPTGPSDLVVWNRESVMGLVTSPNMNFIDTSDFLMSKGSYYELAERANYPWNPDTRRFGDWELIRRAANVGFWGVPVDNISNVYHWTGKNLQTTRWLSDITVIPESIYNLLLKEGKIKPEDGLEVDGSVIHGKLKG